MPATDRVVAMIRPLVLALLLLASPARASEPLPPRLPMAAGDVVPHEGVLLSLPEAGRIVRACRAVEAERDELRRALAESPPPATPTAVLVASGLGLLLGAIAGGWVALQVRK